MKDSYKTIKKQSEGLYKEKGSRFIGLAFPVQAVDETKSIYQNLKKDHHSARHHCFAYRIGQSGELFRTNDDGEPPNSAGKPILAQIDTRGLTNTLVIVIRYFGGTLLGVGGLINAYRLAASDSLDNASIITKTIGHTYAVQFDYTEMNAMNKIIHEEPLNQIDKEFTEKCMFKMHIPLGEEKRIINRIKQLQTVSIKPI